MEKGVGNNESGKNKNESLVEQNKQKAFLVMCDELDERLAAVTGEDGELGKGFEVSGREYDLTSAEDCMVAYAQSMRQEVSKLYEEVKQKDDYYEEKAIAKLLELFKTYERMVALYAELRSYYPTAAARASEHIPSLDECTKHANQLWDKVKESKE